MSQSQSEVQKEVENQKVRFLFTKLLEERLIACVGLASTHVAKHSEKDEAFQGVLNMFCASYEFLDAQKSGIPAPTHTTLKRKWEKMGKVRRITVKKNIAASGIEELYGQYEEELDKLLEKADEKKEKEASAKDEKEKKLKALDEAGKNIRYKALARAASPQSSNTPRKKKQKVSSSTVDALGDKEFKLMEKEADHRLKPEEKRLELDERRLRLAEEQQSSVRTNARSDQ